MPVRAAPAAPPLARLWSLHAATQWCADLARTHYENFTVLSCLTPRPRRNDLAILYAYCRTVDDIGDEAVGDRLEKLDRFERELDAAFDGEPVGPVFVALADMVGRLKLPREPFGKLIEANRIDQEGGRFATVAELLHYCDRSANPVGRLVLMLSGHRDEQLFALSDETCTALQWTNFWQDLRRDARAGRIYLPQDEMAAFGVTEEELLANRASAGLRRLVRHLVERTRSRFAAGLELVGLLDRRLRVEVALFSRGGLAILRKIESQRYDTLVRRPTLGRAEKTALVAGTLASRRWRRWI